MNHLNSGKYGCEGHIKNLSKMKIRGCLSVEKDIWKCIKRLFLKIRILVLVRTHIKKRYAKS